MKDILRVGDGRYGMICVIDYGAGNLRNVCGALGYLGAECIISGEPEDIRKADKVILPGVGSFGDAMETLERMNLVDAIREAAFSGKPFMGICLGMQLMFEASEEAPGVSGLGIFKGTFRKFKEDRAKDIKVPQIGWNSLDEAKGFFEEFKGKYVYFVHSYYLPKNEIEKEEYIGALTDYGERYVCAVAKDNIIACQFHPEKSGEDGLRMLKKFVDM